MKRTLLRASPEPILGPAKVGRSKAVSISLQTAGLLKEHRIKQNELKLSLGNGYVDQDFVFSKENSGLLDIPVRRSRGSGVG